MPPPVQTTTHRPPASASTAGFADDLFDRLWTIHDVSAFAGVGERAAWRLMAHPDAPPRVRLGTRTIRWAPAAIVAFLLGGPGNHPPAAPVGGRDGTARAADPARVTVVPMSPGARIPSGTPALARWAARPPQPPRAPARPTHRGPR